MASKKLMEADQHKQGTMQQRSGKRKHETEDVKSKKTEPCKGLKSASKV